MTTETSKPKRTITNYKDLFIAMAMPGGWENVQEIIRTKKPGRKTHELALVDLHEAAVEGVAEYQAWFDEEYAAVARRGHGKSAPVAGDSRTYKPQRLAKKKEGVETGEYSEPFIRLPLGSLNLDMSNPPLLRVNFEDGRTVITIEGAE